MSNQDDFNRLRNRPGPPDRGRPPDPGAPAFVGVVYARYSIPTTTQVFFAVHPQTILGPEVEGGAPTTTTDAATTVYVAVLGGKAPVVGDALICRFVDHRWVAERIAVTGGGGVRIPSCYCTAIPVDLTMTSSDTTSDGDMFQNCTLHYGPTPSEYAALSLGANCYLSNESFADPDGEIFRYTFGCSSATFNLSRVYAHSVYGSGGAFQDLVRYSWSLGYPGNTCSPFLLSKGRIYSGGAPTTVVTISTPSGP